MISSAPHLTFSVHVFLHIHGPCNARPSLRGSAVAMAQADAPGTLSYFNVLSRRRASTVRNGQSMPVWAVLRSSVHAATCAWTAACVAMRGAKA